MFYQFFIYSYCVKRPVQQTGASALTMNLLAVILLALPVLECNGANILAVLPIPVLSHMQTFRPILKELANRGHNVTHITVIPEENANYNQIVLDNPLKFIPERELDFIKERNYYFLQIFLKVFQFWERIVDLVLSSAEVQEVINSDDLKFDLVLVESTTYQDACVAFGHKFNAPVVEIVTFPGSFWFNHVFSNPYPFSYVIDYNVPLTDKMNFWERLQNTIVGTSFIVMYQYINLPKQQALVNKYMRYPGWESRPSLLELLSNTSLAIINTHVTMNYPHPNNPNIIEVPTLQVQPPKKLPQDLQTYLDSATEGVIYFSFGSLVKGSLMPDVTRQAFISAFAKLPYRILWKWENDSMPNLPSNVRISKWFPQPEILAHRNVKAFITHGGMNSLTEAVYYGVPLIVVPIFFDQLKNGKKMESVGNGLILDFDNITESSVLWFVKEITKPSYKAKVKEQSAILRDNPLPPLDTAMYWIEYVIRHKGAPHLRPASANLSWYQYFLIDVVAFLTGALLLGLLIAYLVLRALFRVLFRRKSEIKTLKKLN